MFTTAALFFPGIGSICRKLSMASYAHADVSIAAGEQRVKKEAFDYDVILEHIGGLGKFQLVTCLWLLVPALFSAVVVMSYSFTGAIPQYRYTSAILLLFNPVNATVTRRPGVKWTAAPTERTFRGPTIVWCWTRKIAATATTWRWRIRCCTAILATSSTSTPTCWRGAPHGLMTRPRSSRLSSPT